ncbi:MAG TPA: LD-carboxypeptidase [Dehalococcoidales bacterium]|nr:LD-carboxypeptidase [Dehalococcoidales bacterium]
MPAEQLKAGDTIGVAAPCYVVEENKYDKSFAALSAMGFRIKKSDNLHKDTYGFSASEEERAGDFNRMIADKEVRMLLFGGGSVSNEILPWLDFENIRRNPKFILSYSDGTTLLDAIYARTGLVTYYGQKPSTFADLTVYNQRQFWSHFVDESPAVFEPNSEWTTICGGSGEGILVGGYLENFGLLLGSQYFACRSDRKHLLFLEDYYDYHKPADVSRYLSHIEQSGFLENVTGLIFGHYSDSAQSELSARLERFGRRNRIPVVACDDFGHGVNNAILPIGVSARLDADARNLVFGAA